MAEEMFETDDVVAAEDALDSIFKEKSSVIGFVKDRYKRSEDSRYADEQRWLKAYRNYRGLYGSDVQFTDTEKSRVFVKVTKTKTLAAYGQIVDVLFGNNKFPLSVNPSVLPEGVAESVHINIDPNAEAAGNALNAAMVYTSAKAIFDRWRYTFGAWRNPCRPTGKTGWHGR